MIQTQKPGPADKILGEQESVFSHFYSNAAKFGAFLSFGPRSY